MLDDNGNPQEDVEEYRVSSTSQRTAPCEPGEEWTRHRWTAAMDPDCQSDLITADVGFKWRPRNYLEAPNEPSRFRRYRLTPKANCELTTPKLPQSDHEDWFVNWDWQLDWMLKLGGVPELPTPANSKRLKKKYQKETELYAAAQMRKDSRNEAIVYWEAISRHLDEKEVARLKANDQLEEQINKNLALLAALRTIDTSTATGNELDDECVHLLYKFN